MVFLLTSGILALGAGLLTIVFGIPIKEFSFGNTMIMAGSVVASAGLIQIGLSFVVREIRQIAGAPDAEMPMPSDAPPARRASAEPPRPGRPARPPRDEILFSRDGAGRDDEYESDNSPPGRRDRSPAVDGVKAGPVSDPTLSDDWRNDLPDHPGPPLPPAADADRPRRDAPFASRRRPSEPREDDAHTEETMPERRDPPSDELGHEQWTQPERSPPAMDGRGPATPGPQRSPPRRNETPPVTIVKSGVVDAMAYSLYSDGSIEAQTPEGMVRFASIDDLRAHLDQRA